MKNVKVVNMPGEIREYVVEMGTTVGQLCDLAGIEVTSESEITADGKKVSILDVVDEMNLVVVTKRIKGNAQKTIKIVNMPGEIKEYMADDSDTVKYICDLADIEVTDESEITADGKKVGLYDVIGHMNLIVVTKRIKGNM